MYSVKFTKTALKELAKLPPKTINNITERIVFLQDEPRPSGVIKLKGKVNCHRIRLGSFRVIYTINDSVLVILIIKIGDRKNIYK